MTAHAFSPGPKEGGSTLLLDSDARQGHKSRSALGNGTGLNGSLNHAPLVRPRASWYIPAKLTVEFLVAAVLLVATAPIILVAAVLVRLTSRGPAFYSQVRIGKNGNRFTIYKIRTMLFNAESLTGPCWSTPGDPRITPVGKWLRRTHLDELPQLVNVIRGQMGLIGPRPERPEFLGALEQAIPGYRQRIAVRPGVTGLAQVQLPPDTDLNSVRRKLAYDLYYICRLGPWLDLRILFCTACYVWGVPSRAARRLCLLPSPQTVEKAVNPKLVESLTDVQDVRRELVAQK
jgi:lipopolysaccharide/colanic/teichoic acid biosynthesis glycosyltransferase